MKQNNSEIYRTFATRKKLTELFIGSTSFDWHYSIAQYKADCREAIPFNLFDKAICGILSIDDYCTIESLGDILGMNIEDNPNMGKYKDIAEYELLKDALSDLEEHELISESNGKYFILPAGRESALQGKKFVKHDNKQFSLYYDVTGGNNAEALSVFKDTTNAETAMDNDTDFEDEENIKTFATHQIPKIFDIEAGNSFSNLELLDIQHFQKPILFALFYDFQLDNIRVTCYDPDGATSFYDMAVEKSEGLKNSIIERFLDSGTENSSNKTEAQLSFEDYAINCLQEIEYMRYLQKDTQEREKEYINNRNLIEEEEFWDSLCERINHECHKVIFSVNLFTLDIAAAITKIALAMPNCKIYVAYIETTYELPYIANNVYFAKVDSTENDTICKTDNCTTYKNIQYVFQHKGISYSTNMVFIDQDESNKEIDTTSFMAHWVQSFMKHIIDQTKEDQSPTFDNIRSIEKDYDSVTSYLEIIQENGLTELYNEMNAEKNKLVNRLKDEHKRELTSSFSNLKQENEIESIKNLNNIQKIVDKMEAIQKECFEDYAELSDDIQEFADRLKQREAYIRDELMAKTYIIDTNVFIDCPKILNYIKMPNKAVVSAKVVDEIDKFKIKLKESDERHGNAQMALKSVKDALTKKKIHTARADLKLLPQDFDEKSADNLILCVALMYKDHNPCLLTSDTGLQVKAEICNIPFKSLTDFLNDLQRKKEEEKTKRENKTEVSNNKTKHKNKRKK